MLEFKILQENKVTATKVEGESIKYFLLLK